MEEFQSALNEIKNGKGASVYLCAGKNRFAMEKFLLGLKKVLFPSGGLDFNYEQIDAQSKKLSEVIDSANQLPVFSARRLVIAENFKMPSEKEGQLLTIYLGNPSPSTVLVFLLKDDKTPQGNSALGKRAKILKFREPYDRELPDWIRRIAASYDKTVEPNVVEYLIGFVGNDLMKIDSELSKLAAYVGDRQKISLVDANALVSDARIETVFEFIDCLSSRDLSSGLRMLDKMMGLGEMPVRIISMLARHYRILWRVKRGLSSGLKSQELAGTCGVSPYFVGKYIEHSRNFSLSALAKVMAYLAKADLELKSVSFPKKLLVEKLCFDLVRL